MSPAKFLPIAILAALTACGSQGNLAWPDGDPAPAPLGAAEPQTVAEMLDPPPQAKPERLDDPVEDGDKRREDPFDLPPN